MFGSVDTELNDDTLLTNSYWPQYLIPNSFHHLLRFCSLSKFLSLPRVKSLFLHLVYSGFIFVFVLLKCSLPRIFLVALCFCLMDKLLRVTP